MTNASKLPPVCRKVKAYRDLVIATMFMTKAKQIFDALYRYAFLLQLGSACAKCVAGRAEKVYDKGLLN